MAKHPQFGKLEVGVEVELPMRGDVVGKPVDVADKNGVALIEFIDGWLKNNDA